MHVDIGSFGHSTGYDYSHDILKLTAAQRKELVRLGLIDDSDDGGTRGMESLCGG